MYFHLQSALPSKAFISRKPFLSCTAERDRNTQRLQEEVLQMEEVATTQRQARLALARAMSAEIKADQVPVIEQQLSDTKATLEEQIRRQDEARVAAEQQFDQMKAALEHQIRVRDQTNAALQQMYQQTKAHLKQFHQMKSTLEHQLQEKEQQLRKNEQIRVTLEAQIQVKTQEKGELERLLYMKDEHIRTLKISSRQDTFSPSSYVGKVHSLALNSVSSRICQLLVQ